MDRVIDLLETGKNIERLMAERGWSSGCQMCFHQVNFARESVVDHALEAFTLVGVAAADAFVGIYGDECPVRTAFDVVGVVIDLRLIAGNCSSLSVEARA